MVRVQIFFFTNPHIITGVEETGKQTKQKNSFHRGLAISHKILQPV
jgi:hypothetical protein